MEDGQASLCRGGQKVINDIIIHIYFSQELFIQNTRNLYAMYKDMSCEHIYRT